MKLIDILVRDLRKFGGWPEGAVECERYMSESDIDFYDKDGNWEGDCYEKYGRDFAAECVRPTTYPLEREIVTRKQYKSALAQAWNGEGLPPVGCECEWHDRNTKSWIPVKVLYSSEWVVVIRGMATNGDIVELGVEVYGDTDRCKFRPIRTEAERKREDAINFMKSKFREITHPCADKVSGQEAVFAAVYDAISAGKMPSVKPESS